MFFVRLAFVILESDEGASRESQCQTMLTRYKQKAPGLKFGRFTFLFCSLEEWVLKLNSKHRCRT